MSLAISRRGAAAVLFHHDPAHDDATLDALTARGIERCRELGTDLSVVGGREGDEYVVEAGVGASRSGD